MSSLRLYHAQVCPYARRTRFVLEHMGITHGEVEVDLRNVPQWYRDEVNPLGRVPGIEHDGFTLYESNPINEYLVEAYGGDLMPVEPKARALVRLRLALADEYWAPAVGRLLRRSRRGAPEAEVLAAREEVVRRLPELDRLIVGDGPFLMGEQLTLADVAFCTALPELTRAGVDVAGHSPRLRQWVEEMEALPAYQVAIGKLEPKTVVNAA